MKYVIMKKDNGELKMPIVRSNDNRKIKSLQKLGYEIVGRMKCDSDFKLEYAVLAMA